MKKLFFMAIIMFTFVSGGFFYGRKLVVLKELAKPCNILIDKQLLLISDNTNRLHLYSFKDFKYLAQMCHPGEGPGEAKNVGFVLLTKNFIFRYILGKNIFYSRDGKFQREFKTRSQMTSFNYPIGNKFICQRSIRRNGDEKFQNDISIYSYSQEKGLVYEKILYLYDDNPITWKGSRRAYRLFYDNHDLIIFEDKIFIGDSTRGLFVQVYDQNGNKISQAKLDIEKTKFSDSYENELTKTWKSNGQWNLFNNQFYFEHPEYFPGFYRYFVGKNKIYFLTYNRKGDQREVIVTDWEGKLIKKAYIPWVYFPYERNFTIFDDKFYYLVDNQETEEWELHVADIK